jgi:hydroxymethylbilane synthase
LVLRDAGSLKELPQGAVIATGSKRRAYQLLALRPDLKITEIRGNVDTRLAKMQTEKLDGLVLAAAGLIRLGLEERITEYLDPGQMIPAPAQGALAIELKSDNKALLEMVNALSDEETECITKAERTFLEKIGGDCHQPIGAHAARQSDGSLSLIALYGDADLKEVRRCETHGTDPIDIAEEACIILQGQAT